MILRFIILVLFSYNTIHALQKLTIGASSVPHAEILNHIKPQMKQLGIDLKVVEFGDYLQPNFALIQGKIDANFFQHQIYLNEFNQSRHANLIPLVKVHLEPIGLYHNNNKTLESFVKTKDIKYLPQNLQVGVPNDATNEGRALKLLEQNHLITINKSVLYPTKRDIIKNPYSLKIIEIDASMLPRLMYSNQLDMAIINANFAMLAGLSPNKDAIFLEGLQNNQYINIIAIRKSDASNTSLIALKKVIISNDVKNFIQTKYKGAVIPAF